MEDIVLIGGGGHCESCIDVIESEGKYRISGIIDRSERLHEKVLGYDIIGCDNDLGALVKEFQNFAITIGQIKSPKRRIDLFNFLKKSGVSLPSIISPRAYISKHAMIGEGTIIMHDVLVNSKVTIGDNCIINSKALLEHGVNVGHHCHISTGAIINGNAKIGSNSFVGSGSVCIEMVDLPSNSFVKATSLIKK